MNTQKSLSRFIIPMEAKSEKFHIPFFHNDPWQFGVLIFWFFGVLAEKVKERIYHNTNYCQEISHHSKIDIGLVGAFLPVYLGRTLQVSSLIRDP
jgi:hypothetical protein